MKIECTKKEYEILAQLVYLGEYMINGILMPEDWDKDITKVKNDILSLAKDHDFIQNVTKDKDDSYNLTADYESEIMDYVSDYDDECFWQELPIRLAQRDLVAEFGESQLEKMSPNEIHDRETLLLTKYQEELEENGIMNIGIIAK